MSFLFVFKFPLSKRLDFEIIGIKLKEQFNARRIVGNNIQQIEILKITNYMRR
jgi:hypothetical protein